MRRSIAVSVVASIVAIAALALLSVGLSHARTMRGNFGLMVSSMHRFDPNDQTDCDGCMSFRMNATQNMHENMPDVYDDMHDHMNMKSHMGG